MVDASPAAVCRVRHCRMPAITNIGKLYVDAELLNRLTVCVFSEKHAIPVTGVTILRSTHGGVKAQHSVPASSGLVRVRGLDTLWCWRTEGQGVFLEHANSQLSRPRR